MATAADRTKSAARPKVLFVSHETTLTGAPIQLLHLVRRLHKEGWNLRVAAPESGPISDLLADAGARAVFFTGAESQKQRSQSVVELHDDAATRVMLLSDAGGVGLNLQHAASACINLELPWNPAVLEQRIARVHRMGQHRPVQVFNLVTGGSIEERVLKTLEQKRSLFEEIFAGGDDEVAFGSLGHQAFLDVVRGLVGEEAPDSGPLAPRAAGDSRSESPTIATLARMRPKASHTAFSSARLSWARWALSSMMGLLERAAPYSATASVSARPEGLACRFRVGESSGFPAYKSNVQSEWRPFRTD